MTFYFAFFIYLRYRNLKLCFLISKHMGIFLIILHLGWKHVLYDFHFFETCGDFMAGNTVTLVNNPWFTVRCLTWVLPEPDLGTRIWEMFPNCIRGQWAVTQARKAAPRAHGQAVITVDSSITLWDSWEHILPTQGAGSLYTNPHPSPCRGYFGGWSFKSLPLPGIISMVAPLW